MKLRLGALLAAVLLASGCWNGESGTRIYLGDVSIGQQLIDLKRALDEGAVSAEEYATLKDGLMHLGAICADSAAPEVVN